jgi:hypothetical protein
MQKIMLALFFQENANSEKNSLETFTQKCEEKSEFSANFFFTNSVEIPRKIL